MPEEAYKILGYRFHDEQLLQEALTHASLADDRRRSNERLEFLGDAILGYIVCEYLYHEFPSLLEGDMTKIKSTVVSRRICAVVTKKINLDGLLSLGKGMSDRQALPSSVAAAVLESIIAAIYLDGGMESARSFILRQLKPLIHEAAASAHQQNFKSVLQHLSQRLLPSNPAYVLLDEKGPDHEKAFLVGVELEGRRYPGAWANSKKQAEQQAALLALLELGLATRTPRGDVQLRDESELQAIEQAGLKPRPAANSKPSPDSHLKG